MNGIMPMKEVNATQNERAADMRNEPARQVRRVLAAVLLLSVVLRLAATVYLGNSVEVLPGTYDQLSYHGLALRVLGGHGFSFGEDSWPMTAANAPTAHWSFLYTFYLAAVYALFGPNPIVARVIQAVVVGLLQPAVAFLLARQVFGERTGLWAAAFTAVYIYFIYYAATLMTEPFYIVALLAGLYLLLRLRRPSRGEEMRLSIMLGLVLAAAVLLRQLFLMLIPFLLLWLWIIRTIDARRADAGRSSIGPVALRAIPWRPTLVVVLLCAAFILPFTAYNTARFGRVVLLNTNAGYAFFWANHPVYGTRFRGILPSEMGSYTDLIPPELRGLDEAELESALMARGLGFVRDDPIRYLRLSLSRIPVYFMFWPSADSGLVSNISRVGSFALFLPLMLAGLVYSLVRRVVRRASLGDASLLLLFMALYAGVHLASWALIRYRLPLDAVLLVYAGLAAAVAQSWWTARRARKAEDAS